ncbi:MAG: NUDIX domain-containing protein [Nocardioides sp.]
MLFGEAGSGPVLLLTERAHHMRSHPGQVSFPGGFDPGETPRAAALREAEGGDRAGPDGHRSSAELPRALPAAVQLRGHLGARLVGAADPGARVDPDEVHAVFLEPIEELLDPAHRVSVRHPSGGWGRAS